MTRVALRRRRRPPREHQHLMLKARLACAKLRLRFAIRELRLAEAALRAFEKSRRR